MDQSQLQEKIALYYQRLPEETKVLFAGMSWLETLTEIDTKYSLNDEQIKTLGTETTILLLGIISPDDYEITIREEVRLENNKIDEIIKEVNERIVKDIAPLIYQSYNDNMVSLADEIITQNLDKRFSLLPQDVQNAIALSDWKAKLYNIAQKYNLAVDKMGILEEITTQAIGGNINANKYSEEVKEKINIQSDKLNDFILEINESIFKDIKEIMKNGFSVYDKNDIDIPLPPYSQPERLEIKVENNTINDDLPPPPPEYKGIIKKEELGIKTENSINKNETQSTQDIYRENGIEIISEGDIVEPQEEKISSGYTVSNKKEEVKVDIPTNNNFVDLNQKSEEIIKNVKTAAPLNIISNKLFNKTTSQTTVADYSIPKITQQTESSPKISGSSVNLHDPYHEII